MKKVSTAVAGQSRNISQQKLTVGFLEALWNRKMILPARAQLECYAPTANQTVQIVAAWGVTRRPRPITPRVTADAVGVPPDYVNALNASIGVSLDGIVSA